MEKNMPPQPQSPSVPTTTQPKPSTPESSDINQKSVFIQDLGMIKVYGKNVKNPEIEYDVATSVRGQTPDEYYLNTEPQNNLTKAFKAASDYMTYGQQAMKMFAVAPDVALGLSDDLKPEELAKTYQTWHDLWKESPVGKKLSISSSAPEFLQAHPVVSFIPWFLAEYMPAELTEWGTKPSGWITAGGLQWAGQKFGPPIINKLLNKFPEGTRKALLTDFWNEGTRLIKDYDALGLSPNATTSQVTKAWQNMARQTHPDMPGGDKVAFQNLSESYQRIIKSRGGIIDKLFNLFREQPRRLPNLASQSGQADIVPSFEPGDLAKMGKDTVKVIKLLGETVLVNQAGKEIEVPLKKLVTHPKSPQQQLLNTIKDLHEMKGYIKEAEKNQLVDDGEGGKKIIPGGTWVPGLKGVKSAQIDALLNKIQTGKPMTDIQKSLYEKLQNVAAEMKAAGESLEKFKLPPSSTPPPAANVAPGASQGPKKSAVNLKNLDIWDDAKERIVEATGKIEGIENQTGNVLSHEQVIEKAKEAAIFEKGVTPEKTLDFEARLLRTRQDLAALAEQETVTPEFLQRLRTVANIGTDFARTLESFKIKAMPEFAKIKNDIIQKLFKLGKTNEEIMEAAKGVDFKNPDQAATFYRKFVKPTLWETLNEFAYINILSSPITHAVNISSNLLQGAATNPATKLASGKIGQVIPYYKGFVSAIPKAIDAATKVMQGTNYVERPDVEHLPTKAPWIEYATAGMGKYVPRALEAEDVLVRTMIEEGERQALMASVKGEITPEMQQKIDAEAAKKAEYWVYRSKPDTSNASGQGDLLTMIDKMTSAIYGVRRAIPGAQWYIRFVQTPMNILKQGIEFSPLGIATLKGNTNKQDQIGKMMVGGLVFAGGVGLAMQNRLSWSLPKDKSDRDLSYQAGIQPFSMNIAPDGEDPVWVSYSKLGPLSYPIMMAAALDFYWNDARSADADSHFEKMFNFSLSLMEFFSEQSYVRPLGDMTKAMQGDKQSVSNLITSVPEQLMPFSSFQGWVNSAFDPYYRKPARGLSFETILDNIQKKIILGSQFVPPAPTMEMKPAENKDRAINAVSPLKIQHGNLKYQKMYEDIQDAKRAAHKMQEQADKNYDKIVQEYMRKFMQRSEK
jgi:hypothetical protein